MYGFACRHFAAKRRVDGFEAFLAGMLQNVGIIVALRVMDQLPEPQPEQMRSLTFFVSFAHYARRLARHAGRHWELPEQVIAVIGDDAAPARTAASGAGGGLPEVLHLADKLAKISLLVNQGRLDEADVEACVEDHDLTDCMDCYREVAEQAREQPG